MTAVGVACKFLLVVFITFGASKTRRTLVAAEEDGGGGASRENNGVLIGKLNVYHHGVSGSVYAVNETTLLFKDFNYDGQGKDAYFWGGAGGTGPGPNGFIIPDEHGKTNILRKYANSVFTLTLPDRKKISELKWIAIYDLSRLENFGDVYVPDGFEAPRIIELPALVTKSDVDCGSEAIDLIDMKTIKINRFYLNVYKEEMYFSIGKGHVPSLRPGAGWIIPDELGYLAPLRPYVNEDVTLTLPGEYVFGDEDIHWLAVYDKTNDKSVCYVNIPQMGTEAIQPSLVQIYKHEYSLPNCEPLHRDYHLAWDVMGQTITFEVVARTEDESAWLGLGISGNSEVPQMKGSDMAIGWLNLKTGQGNVRDYNVDSKAPCTSLLDGKKLGICPDVDLGGSDSVQVLEGRRVGPVTVLKYRRQLKKAEEKDKDIDVEKPTGLIWAVGRMMSNGQPGFHELYNKRTLKNVTFLKTAKKTGEDSEDDSSALFNKCLPFVLPSEQQKIVPWQEVQVIDGKLRSFSARLGPSGSIRGKEGRTGVGNPGYAWYIQGYLSPELFLQRGVTYSFKVEGGNNPQAVDVYHPFVITREKLVDTNKLNEILAGIEITRRGTPKILASGRLCMWSHRPTYDRRLDVSYSTFEKFRNTLKLKCDNSSDYSILEVTPNSSWPDTVYYNSFTQPDMGGLIRIVDNLDSGSKYFRGSASSVTPTSTLAIGVLFICLLTRLVNLAVTF